MRSSVHPAPSAQCPGYPQHHHPAAPNLADTPPTQRPGYHRASRAAGETEVVGTCAGWCGVGGIVGGAFYPGRVHPTATVSPAGEHFAQLDAGAVAGSQQSAMAQSTAVAYRSDRRQLTAGPATRADGAAGQPRNRRGLPGVHGQGAPRAVGLREALRMVFACREGVLVSRTKAINELKSLIVVAPEQLRAQLRGRSLAVQLIPDRAAARVSVSTDGGPALLAEPGVGPVVAAQLLISWSHHGRVRSDAAFASLAGVAPIEASSGQRSRHRLNRGGDRAPNRALHTVAITRIRCHPETCAYEIRRSAKARPTATSDAPSNAHSPDASTAGSRLRFDSTSSPTRLDRHRSVE
jgi:hypothetical protein